MMKNIYPLFLFFLLFSCVPRALNNAFVGMSERAFLEMSNNNASVDQIEGQYKIYRYNWASPGSEVALNTTFYYFKDGILLKVDGGVRQNNNTQLRLNYNLN